MSSSIEEQYRFIREKSWENNEEQVRHITIKMKKVATQDKRYHSKERQHDPFILHHRLCPNCLGGSIPETDEEYKIRKQKEMMR